MTLLIEIGEQLKYNWIDIPKQLQIFQPRSINLENRSTAIASSKNTNLGFLQYDLGEIEQAMSNWNRSLKLNPGTNHESQLAIASVLYSQGKFDEAILLAKPILMRYPQLKNPQYLNQSSWSSELLILAKKMYGDRRLNNIIGDRG